MKAGTRAPTGPGRPIRTAGDPRSVPSVTSPADPQPDRRCRCRRTAAGPAVRPVPYPGSRLHPPIRRPRPTPPTAGTRPTPQARLGPPASPPGYPYPYPYPPLPAPRLVRHTLHPADLDLGGRPHGRSGRAWSGGLVGAGGRSGQPADHRARASSPTASALVQSPGHPGRAGQGGAGRGGHRQPVGWLVGIGATSSRRPARGMILTPDGEVLTNNHVVSGATSVTVTLFGQTKALPAHVLGTDPSRRCGPGPDRPRLEPPHGHLGRLVPDPGGRRRPGHRQRPGPGRGPDGDRGHRVGGEPHALGRRTTAGRPRT